MKPWTLRGVAPLPLLVATLFAASSLARGQTSAPGSETHLLRARARSDRGDLLLVPLPLAEIGSREAAEDWLRWAGETHPAFENRIRGVWDSDTFELSVRPELSFLLCEGDPAADPSGRVLLRVAETPGANAKKAKFRFDGADFGNADSTAEGMAPGMASPLLCISNAWVLPRSVLLDRWTREASGSRAGAAGVRREAERLLEALDRLSQGGSGRWRSEVSAFVRTNAFVWPGIVLSNECGRTVRIEGLGAPFDLPAGTSRSLFLSAPPKDDVVRWSARDASDPDDADSEWEPEAVRPDVPDAARRTEAQSRPRDSGASSSVRGSRLFRDSVCGRDGGVRRRPGESGGRRRALRRAASRRCGGPDVREGLP